MDKSAYLCGVTKNKNQTYDTHIKNKQHDNDTNNHQHLTESYRSCA